VLDTPRLDGAPHANGSATNGSHGAGALLTTTRHNSEFGDGNALAVPGLEAVRSSENDNELTLNMGPQHPSTHGVFRLILQLDGETVVGVTPIMGYLHRSSEKLGEARTYVQAVTLTDRMDYLSPMTMNWSYALAVEKLAGLEVPERAEYIRVIVGELSRLSSHLVAIGTFGAEPRRRGAAL